jgi:hypothetical protein
VFGLDLVAEAASSQLSPLGSRSQHVDLASAADETIGPSEDRDNRSAVSTASDSIEWPHSFHQTIKRTRTAQVLAKMVEAGFVRENEASAALMEGTSFAVVARPGSRYFADWAAE